MTVNQLHKITTALRAQKQGNIEVAINHASFPNEAAHLYENGAILLVGKATLQQIQGADDSGPVGRKFPFLVLDGESLDGRQNMADSNSILEPDHRAMLERLNNVAAKAQLHESVKIDEADLRQLLAFANKLFFA